MPHQQQGGVLTLGHALKRSRTLPHLGHGTGGTGQIAVMKGLDAVDDRHIGLQSLKFLEDQIQIGFRQKLKIAGVCGEALPAQFHLLGRLLSAHVKHGTMAGDGRCALQQQGALADPRVTTHQNERTGNQPTTENAIQFSIPAWETLQWLVAKGSHRR